MNDSNILHIAEKFNLPILIHSGLDELCDPNNIYMLAKMNPKVRFCVAHNGDFSSSFIEAFLAEPLRNLFVDSGPLMVMCMKISSNEHMKIGRLNIDYANPHQVFRDIFKIFPDSLVWSSDEPWTIVGKLDNGMDIYWISYEQEASIYASCEFKKSLSQNVKRYLFGA